MPAALLAAGFLAPCTSSRTSSGTTSRTALGYSSPPWFLMLAIRLAGAVIVIVARRFLPGDGGHDAMGGLSMAPTALAAGPGVALAAIGTLSFGLVLGPEAPADRARLGGRRGGGQRS